MEINPMNIVMESITTEKSGMPPPTVESNAIMIKALRKKLKKLEEKDEKAFMDMLQLTSRNHYTLNQMVDRKARILLSGNVLFLSLIIGKNILSTDVLDWDYLVLAFFGIACFISIIYAMFAVLPEKFHGSFDETSMLQNKGIPLFFGNFKSISEDVFTEQLLTFIKNREVIYRSLIQDIYHLGLVLESKRKFLRTSLWVFVTGLCLSLLFSFLLRLL